MDVELQLTADGSPTLYRADIDEHYHSVKGALAESMHVYVGCGYRFRASLGGKRPLRVLEVGFGTGLNAALTMLESRSAGIATHYVSLELFPLDAGLVRGMEWGEELSSALACVGDAAWNEAVEPVHGFVLEKRVADFCNCELPEGVDVVYFDAFAPEKQPEMWSREGFERLYASMAAGGTLTTYCAKGAVRRMLESVGFVVSRIAGPANGKREILRCVKPETVNDLNYADNG